MGGSVLDSTRDGEQGAGSRERSQALLRNEDLTQARPNRSPPIGRHRYFHKLYALDTMLPDLDTPTKTQLESAMADHILAQATLMGTYQK